MGAVALVLAETLLEGGEGLGDVLLHHFYRDMQPLGNLFVSQTLETAHGKDLLAPWRESVHHAFYLLVEVLIDHAAVCAVPHVHGVELFATLHTGEGFGQTVVHHRLVPQVVDAAITHHREEEGGDGSVEN